MQETTTRPAPVLTLSIVTYNSEKWLPAFFESLQKQDLPCDQIALCVLDNGSTDGTFACGRRSVDSTFASTGCMGR
jgi:GT2 family glycosyltransferase